jgi:hypothetical protein
MEDQPATAKGWRRNGLFLISNNMRVAMMLSRLVGIGQCIAAAKRKHGGERDDGSNPHGFSFCCLAIAGLF